MFQEKLYEAIREKQNPTVLGLDPKIDYVPKSIIEKASTKIQAIDIFNRSLIDGLSDLIPAIKCQSAYYEQLGPVGALLLQKTMAYAKEKGMLVILDCKRNDIGSTASAYANAYLTDDFYLADAITVNGYLGSDGIEPFLKACSKYGKGIYILVKTSNPSSGELQDLKLEGGQRVYEKMAELVQNWGSELIGKYGFSSVGAVVGATYKEQLTNLRKSMSHTPFLVPGYGAQGGSASDVSKSFTSNGNGAIINSSRGLMCAYKKHQLPHEEYIKAARIEAKQMKHALNQYITWGETK